MPDILTELAERLGDKPALIDDRPAGETIRWSYADLEANANRLANAFLDHGVEPGNRVMWCGRNSHWPVACGHAARKVGAAAGLFAGCGHMLAPPWTWLCFKLASTRIQQKSSAIIAALGAICGPAAIRCGEALRAGERAARCIVC